MALHHLPNKLLLRIAWFLLKCETCHCHHVSHPLSALARCSPRLFFLLTPELLPTPSALNILLWAIGHSRQDTVTLAIKHGADPNLPLCETHCFNRMPHHVRLGTPLEIAFRMRMRAIDPASNHRFGTCEPGGGPGLDSCYYSAAADCFFSGDLGW